MEHRNPRVFTQRKGDHATGLLLAVLSFPISLGHPMLTRPAAHLFRLVFVLFQFMVQLGLPPTTQQWPAPFQPSLPQSLPPCPLCRPFPAHTMTGQWNVSLWSRSFRLNAFSQLDKLIERTQAGMAFSEEQTFQELVADPPESICPSLTGEFDYRLNHQRSFIIFSVLNASLDSTKWEFAYRVFPLGCNKSIIGTWERLPSDGSFQWRVGSLNLAQCA